MMKISHDHPLRRRATASQRLASVLKRIAGCAIVVAMTGTIGCQKSTPDVSVDAEATQKAPTQAAAPDVSPQTYEASGEQLLAARLPLEETSQGWIRLFDGHTLFGWEITGKANWKAADGVISVDQGEPCLLCTSVPWQDFELALEFNADSATNSGVFLRTPLQPEDPASDCYEVNIAPDDNPFPTASVVQRQKVDAEKAPPQVADTWRQMTMRLEGNRLQVLLDGVVVTDFTDETGLEIGRIGLQHNEGRIAFREIRLRPLGLDSLIDPELSEWKPDPNMPEAFSHTDEGTIHVQGGRAQLESKEEFGDFVLLTDYKTEKPETNSGIFFRCIPGEQMNGYECQINDEMIDSMPLMPKDCGTGGIFRRQDARVVAGNPQGWSSLVLVAQGDTFAAWVNGIQVSDFQDTRPPDPNPRRGLRLEAGTLMIQGHDPGTQAWLRNLAINPVD